MSYNLGRLVGCLLLALAMVLLAKCAWAQSDGFAITSDGQVYQFDQNGGATYGPDGSGSWDSGSGYSVNSDGGYSAWGGSVEPTIPADPVPIEPMQTP